MSVSPNVKLSCLTISSVPSVLFGDMTVLLWERIYELDNVMLKKIQRYILKLSL